jgi:hypothetical protein
MVTKKHLPTTNSTNLSPVFYHTISCRKVLIIKYLQTFLPERIPLISFAPIQPVLFRD